MSNRPEILHGAIRQLQRCHGLAGSKVKGVIFAYDMETTDQIVADLESRLSAMATRVDDLEDSEAQLIGERDLAETYADKLAAVIATITGVDIGEHSNLENPWANALEAAGEYSSAPPAASDTPKAVCVCQLKGVIDRPVCREAFIQHEHANPANMEYCGNKHAGGSYCGHNRACHPSPADGDKV